MTNQDERDGIVAALDTLLDAIREDNDRRRGDLSAPVSAAEIGANITFEETRLELDTYELIRHPIGRALRMAVKVLGARLNEFGGMSAMHQAMGQVADLKPDMAAWREGILDRLWDGIGDWLA